MSGLALNSEDVNRKNEGDVDSIVDCSECNCTLGIAID